jgi:hypothetical protein
VEAESGTLAGGATVQALTSPPNNSFSSPTLEASGHAYVQINATGQSVTLQNNTGQSITALNVRYAIPDSSGGGGITSTMNLYVNGVFRQTINLSSVQTWCYETSGSQNGFSQTPSSGQPHLFFDEAHFFIVAPAVAAGSTITLKKDSANTASFYWIDVVDMENPPGPLSQPANSLSITSYGAVANNPSTDNTTAINNCFSACRSQGKIAWIPSGTFYLNKSPCALYATSITIQGAGMWYSTIYANPSLPASGLQNILACNSCTVQDVFFDSNARSRLNADGNGGGLIVSGNNWVINRVWVQHEGAGVWADGVTGTVENSRLLSCWADGVNLNNGNGGSGNTTGNNLTVTNCFVRGPEDDGLALNSGSRTGNVQMQNCAIVNCTSVAPRWANNLGIYGGANISVKNNLLADSVGQYGLSIGQFTSNGMPLDSGTVANNTLNRCGCYGFYNQAGIPALNVGTSATIKNVNVADNTVNNALFMGVGLNFCGANVVVQNNTVNAPGTTGVLIPSGSSGSAQIQYNVVENLKSGQSAYINNASGTFTATLTGNSWQGAIFYQNTQYGGTASQALSVGTYTLAQLAAKGVPNDWASSARVPSGRTVIMYHDDNFAGTSWTLTSDTPDFSTLSPSANDQMSSCKIQ